MKSRYWKIAVILITLGIIFTFAWTQSFHSVNRTYLTFPKDGNGTAIIVFSLSSVSANGEIQIASNNATVNSTHVPVNIMFENGTSIAVGSTQYFLEYAFSVKFHFNSSALFQSGYAASGGFANISISNTDPIAVAMVKNISAEFFLHSLPGLAKSYGQNVNFYAIYIDTYATVNVKVVGGAL